MLFQYISVYLKGEQRGSGRQKEKVDTRREEDEAADNSISCFSMFCVCREIQFSDVRMLAKWGVIYIY